MRYQSNIFHTRNEMGKKRRLKRIGNRGWAFELLAMS